MNTIADGTGHHFEKRNLEAALNSVDGDQHKSFVSFKTFISTAKEVCVIQIQWCTNYATERGQVNNVWRIYANMLLESWTGEKPMEAIEDKIAEIVSITTGATSKII